MAQYKVYEVDLHGEKHLTGKILEVETPPVFEGQSLISRGTVVINLLAMFGFSQYVHMYTPYRAGDKGQDVEVRYPYIALGHCATWYLELMP